MFIPVFNHHNGEVKGYTAEYRNLRLYFWGNYLYIRNSLHKFYHGNNYGCLTCSEITSSLDELNMLLASGFTGIDVRRAEVTYLEYGVNLEMENPETYWGQLTRYGGKPFRAMESSSGTAYGAVRKLKQYELKAYSKCFQANEVDRVKINGRLRLEVVVKEIVHLTARKNNPIPIRTVADLEGVEVLTALANDLMEKFRKVEKSVPPPIGGKLIEKNAFNLFTHPDEQTRKNAKREHVDSYGEYRSLYLAHLRKAMTGKDSIEAAIKAICDVSING